ncbi:hypothetical protein [Aliivibrio salmonicida]|uniref:hypothetical protein n=1 Tax=Aliivibrio salmonicida TaxID=40269 RepID=UPI003D1503C4
MASLLALTLSPLASAKVTYADAVKDQSAYNAKMKALAPPPAVGYTAADLADIGSEWEQIYSGNTTGNITIPSNAKMLTVQTSEGIATFPRDKGSLTLATVTNTESTCGLSATANAIFTGSQVRGGEQSSSKNCGGHKQSDQRWGSVQAKITIQKVLILK